MTLKQQIITIAILSVTTIFTRFIAFAVFNEKRKCPKIIYYLGKVLPPAVFGMLIVYCFKDVDVSVAPHGIPELIALCITLLTHKLFHKLILSVVVGTASYMILIQLPIWA